MNIGYFNMPLHPPGSNHTKTYEDDIEQIVFLDQLGFDEAWIGEHFTAEWENIPAPDIFISYLFAITKSIKLGTGVNCLPNHNPFVLAHRIAQIDHMSKGRFLWGIGSGGFIGDLKLFRHDAQTGTNREMTKESLDLIFQIWNDPKPGVYESKWWELEIPEEDKEIGLRTHLKPFQKPHPPIGVAGVSPNSETLKIAGANEWLPLSINFAHVNILKTHWDSIEEGAKKANKIPNRLNWRISREIIVSESRKEAEKEILKGVISRDFEEYFLKMLPKYSSLEVLKKDPNMPDSDVDIKYLMNNIFIYGTPSDVLEKIQELNYSVGGFGTLLAMGHEWNNESFWKNSMILLKKEILPKVI